MKRSIVCFCAIILFIFSFAYVASANPIHTDNHSNTLLTHNYFTIPQDKGITPPHLISSDYSSHNIYAGPDSVKYSIIASVSDDLFGKTCKGSEILYYVDPSTLSVAVSFVMYIHILTGQVLNLDKLISGFSANPQRSERIPEPVTMILVGIGLISVSVLRKRDNS